MEPFPEEPVPKKHVRNVSTGKANLPRRSTRGPLDILQVPVSTSSSPSDSQILSPPPSQSRSPGPPPSSAGKPELSQKDFSKLLRPEIYHPLPQLEIPVSFRQSSTQPSTSSSLPDLLSKGHFRAAAILSAQLLITDTQPWDSANIFSLLYVRLACLTLCNATALAAQEVKALEDLNSSIYRDDLTGAHLVPWELRVLAVRLQWMGFNDPRKGIMGYYDLAREARAELSKLKIALGQSTDPVPEIQESIENWKSRLSDLGLRVTSALVEMEDLESASQHLATLDEAPSQNLESIRALLWLRLGDITAANQCLKGDPEGDTHMRALAYMAEGKYNDAVTAWQQLLEKEPTNEMFSQNLAVCMLYSGRMDEARKILEGVVQSGHSFHALTFNLSTIYELCTDRSRALKLQLTEQIAALPEGRGSGWEKTNADFKL